MNNIDKEKRIKEIKELCSEPSFWNNPQKAKELIQELRLLNSTDEHSYAKSLAIISIVSGAGGDDAEDFSRMLFVMYIKYCESNRWDVDVLEQNANTNNGIKSTTFVIKSTNSYNKLKDEQGVHRLVRLSPFNANNKRQTSFVLVSVIPKILKSTLRIEQSDLKIELSTSSGPGGQNVNKRETAVRVIHLPTNISVRIEKQRTQEQNMQLAMSILHSKLQYILNVERKNTIDEISYDKNLKIEWGNQIRSYILHPYKLVKDHRTGYQENNPENIFNGHIEGFLKKTNSL